MRLLELTPQITNARVKAASSEVFYSGWKPEAGQDTSSKSCIQVARGPEMEAGSPCSCYQLPFPAPPHTF